MSQMSFGDAEYAGKKKRTPREVFVAEMDQVIPSGSLLRLIEPLHTIFAPPPAAEDAGDVQLSTCSDLP